MSVSQDGGQDGLMVDRRSRTENWIDSKLIEVHPFVSLRARVSPLNFSSIEKK